MTIYRSASVRLALVCFYLVVLAVSCVSAAPRSTLPQASDQGHSHGHHVARHLITRDNAEILAAASQTFDQLHDNHSLTLFTHLRYLVARSVHATMQLDGVTDEQFDLFTESWALKEYNEEDNDGDDDDDDVDEGQVVVETLQSELQGLHHKTGPADTQTDRERRDALYVPYETVLDHSVIYRRQPHKLFHGIRSVVDALIDDEIVRISHEPHHVMSEKTEPVMMNVGGTQVVRVSDWYLYRTEEEHGTDAAPRERNDFTVYFLKIHRKRQVEWDPESGRPEPQPDANAPWIISEIESFPTVHGGIPAFDRTSV